MSIKSNVILIIFQISKTINSRVSMDDNTVEYLHPHHPPWPTYMKN